MARRDSFNYGTAHLGNRLRRGVTLLELLVALGLMLALLAIAFPFTMRMLEERELATTEENIASELIRARVRAQESGKAVEVVVLEGAPSRIAMHYFDATSRSDGSRASRESDDVPVSTERDRPLPNQRHRRSSADPVRDLWWEESDLDSSIRVASSDDSADDDQNSDRQSKTLSHGGSMRIAVFLPDGSILFAATLFLLHDSGLCSRVSVDPWTGQPAIERGATDDRNGQDAASDALPCPPETLSDKIHDEWGSDSSSATGERGSTR